MRKTVTYLHVRAISACTGRGFLACGGISVKCALGRSGRRVIKREGDGASPVGIWALRQCFYRRDRLLRPTAGLPFVALRRGWGWCETPGDRNYNRKVDLPYHAAHEDLVRTDRLYDIVIETDHNRRPRVQGGGSAIFFHLARPDYAPTAGCIALSLQDMVKVLQHCGPRTRLVIWPPGGTPPNVFRK